MSEAKPRLCGPAPYRLTLISVVLTCALAPAYIYRWHYGPLPTTLLEQTILLTVFVFVVESIRQRSAVPWKTPFTLPVVLFLTAGALAVAVSPAHIKGLGLYRAYLLEPVAFFIVMSSVVRTSSRALLIVGGLAIAALWVSVANLRLYLPILLHPLPAGAELPVALYTTQNAIPLFVLPVAALEACMVVFDQRWSVRAAGLVGVIINVVTSLLTFSRGGVLAMVAIALGLAMVHRRRALLVPGALAIGASLAFVPAIRHRFGEVITLSPNDPRISLWRTTLAMMRHHPLLGVGLSGFQQAMERFDPGFKERYNAEPLYPHNIVLNFWAILGVLGLVAFAWIILQGLRLAYHGFARGPRPWRAFHAGAGLALVAILVHGQVDVPYFKNDLSLEFWALLGLIWAGTRWNPTIPEREVAAPTLPLRQPV